MEVCRFHEWKSRSLGLEYRFLVDYLVFAKPIGYSYSNGFSTKEPNTHDLFCEYMNSEKQLVIFLSTNKFPLMKIALINWCNLAIVLGNKESSEYRNFIITHKWWVYVDWQAPRVTHKLQKNSPPKLKCADIKNYFIWDEWNNLLQNIFHSPSYLKIPIHYKTWAHMLI